MTNPAIPHYDVIIIGAGSIGAPTAFYMAEAGLKVLVLDCAPSVGQGSNKRAIGGIRATHSDPAKISLCLRSLEIFSTWKEMYGDDIEWEKGGYLFVSYRDRETKVLKDLLTIQKKFGLNIDWYDPAALTSHAPGLNQNGLQGGTFSPDDGNASPLLSNHAFFRQAVKKGAQFRFNESITGIIVESGRVRGVRTMQGTYGADVVLNAAGAWAAQMGDYVGMKIPVTPDSHEAAVTEPVEHFMDPMVVDIRPATGSSNYYFYQHKTGQIIFCITPSPNIWGFDTQETSTFLPMVAKRMVDLMPRLKNIRVRRTWRGLYPMTPDGYPIIGWSKEASGFLLGVGMCGQGFMLGPGVGELLTRMVLGKETDKDNEILGFVDPYRKFAGQELLK